MPKIKKIVRICRCCSKKYRHPDAYSGRCENCFAAGQAHQDSVRAKSRKTSTGQNVKFFYNAGHGGSINRVRSTGKVGTAW